MWNKKKSVVPPDSDLAKLQRELTPDEKQKLYEAIGYQVTLMIMMLVLMMMMLMIMMIMLMVMMMMITRRTRRRASWSTRSGSRRSGCGSRWAAW